MACISLSRWTAHFFKLSLLALLPGFIATGCSSFYYYPVKNFKIYEPNKLGLQPQDIYFKDEAGRKLHGWYFESKKTPATGTFVFFHGNAENITSHFVSLSWLPEAGYNYFVFDYPGYGLSEGEPYPESTIQSGRAAIRWVHENKDQRPLVIFAHSLGGIIGMRSVLDVKNEIPLKAVIIDASFLSYKTIARKKLSNRWFLMPLQGLTYLVLSDEYAPKKISDISPIPFLVIHGQKDQVVEPEFGEEIFNKAGEPKDIWRIPNGVHGNTFFVDDKKYQTKLLDWLKQIK